MAAARIPSRSGCATSRTSATSAVVKEVAENARWQARPNPDRGKGDVMTGRGVSYTERNGTVVAVVAEVEVDRRSGRVWAKKFRVAHDCGQIINPARLR